MPVTCTSCDTTCPETVDVTIQNITNTGTGRNVSITVADTTDPLAKLVTIQALDSNNAALSGNYEIRLWFIDNSSDLNTPSAQVPETPGWAENLQVTNSSGLISLTVRESRSGYGKTWYLAASIASATAVSDPITISI